MYEIATIEVTDVESNEEAVVILRAAEGCVGICVSLKEDGDVELFLTPQDCRKVVEALSKATRFAEKELEASECPSE